MMLLLRGGLAMFGTAGLLTKLIVVGSLAVTLLSAGGIVYHHIWSNGYDKAIANIAAQDVKAVAKAKKYRSAFNDCRARGLRWDQSTLKCEGG
jgi:hypothetical protein